MNEIDEIRQKIEKAKSVCMKGGGIELLLDESLAALDRLGERQWVSVEDRLPPDNWFGLVLTNVRPDKPVVAHVSDERYREEFPFASYFMGRWREAILIGDHVRSDARVTYWLEGFEYPEPPNDKENGDEQSKEGV